ncbi:MAG: glycosyltransferase [Clostridia bacterium]|nr:glycosyltransferase [Clostridia bacterium]MBR2735193.1 glycosyltransferase [Clostridia bacterium]
MNKFSKKILGACVLTLSLAVVGVIAFKNMNFKGQGPKEPNETVSVIIPVYKVEDYLDDCLNSVQNQTYKDIEIICVNDGSPDNSGEILKRHQKKDKRIKIINQENQGISVTRNVGMKAATGNWIYFLDSDDLIVPYTLEKAVESAKQYDAEIVNFKYEDFSQHLRPDLSEKQYQGLGKRLVEVKDKENPFKVFNLDKVNVWQNLYKRSFLEENNIKFEKGIICEDVLFTWKCELCAKKMVKDDNVYYLYRYGRVGSIMNSDFKKIEKRLESFFTIIEELVKMRPDFDFEGIDEQFLDMILVLFYEPIAHEISGMPEQKEYAKRAVHIIEDNYINEYNAVPNKEQNKKIKELKALAQ